MSTSQHRGSKNPILIYLVAGPLIWLMIVPVVIADIFVEIYHRICFPIYGIPYVKRSQYIRILDREKLPYLSWGEKSAARIADMLMDGSTTHQSLLAEPRIIFAPSSTWKIGVHSFRTRKVFREIRRRSGVAETVCAARFEIWKTG